MWRRRVSTRHSDEPQHHRVVTALESVAPRKNPTNTRSSLPHPEFAPRPPENPVDNRPQKPSPESVQRWP